MTNTNIIETLRNLEIEDIIWIVSLFTASRALVSNQIERDYLINNNKQAQKAFKTINRTILTIAFFIYLYFLFLAYNNLKKANPTLSFKQARTLNLNFIAASLFVVAGTIYLVLELSNSNSAEVTPVF